MGAHSGEDEGVVSASYPPYNHGNLLRNTLIQDFYVLIIEILDWDLNYFRDERLSRSPGPVHHSCSCLMQPLVKAFTML